MADKKKSKKPVGSLSERLAIEGDWEDATRKALAKKPPAEGWPERQTKRRTKRGPKQG